MLFPWRIPRARGQRAWAEVFRKGERRQGQGMVRQEGTLHGLLPFVDGGETIFGKILFHISRAPGDF